MKINFLQL